MYTKIALLGLIGSAAAFNAPMMVSRRDAVATGAAAAAVAPLLRPAAPAKAKAYVDSKAPVLVFFDETDGCVGPVASKSMVRLTTGETGDDGVCIKISMEKIGYNREAAIDVAQNYNIVRYGASKGSSSGGESGEEKKIFGFL
uniref:Uncharacterized protein n=1 Tax=Hemiselmis tepida TaxID=464990 RepID=A0A7S0YRV5_9CRYP|mmetsp:Transcript_22098/g.55719  ORF Transcript_22098/g.55719 Transcript_22098/m.55719 type:complete len:143 (+) Transcript_22098:74-502(+)